MEGLLGGAQLQGPRSTTSTFLPLAAPSTSYMSTVRLGRSSVVPNTFGGLRSVRQPSSPALKIHASKKKFTSFDDMINNSKLPILVDFYATWCGPCQFMAPILKEVGAEMKDKITVVKVDTEKYPQVASRYRITALPTFVLFVNGKAIRVLEGAQKKDELIAYINQTLDEQKVNIGN